MYKIGDFSKLAKTTVKTLRYYEKEGLLIPSYTDSDNGYRYYETKQLLSLAKIVHLKQLGFSIDDIKSIMNGANLDKILHDKKVMLEKEIENYTQIVLQINNILEEKNMKKEVIIKELPDYTVYYKEGVIENYSKIGEFVLQSAEECLALNPNIKCIEPDYCYISYLDGEYKENNIKIRYTQAVETAGVEDDKIKFAKLEPVSAACIYHKGSYSNFPESYQYILKWISDNGYEIIDAIRERYIDGVWNTEDENNYLTEIMIPIKKK